MKIGTLRSGEVVTNRPRSHIHANPALQKHLPLALARIDSINRDFITETIDFGEIIGETNCVETLPENEIVLAVRKGRGGPSRFVKDRLLVPTSKLTVVLLQTKEGYVLITAYLGPKAEREPWDPRADDASKEFWKTHALVWGSEECE